ncbi:hypothetical protein SERLA73DRAFT_58688 [Serpula lacrymans var. lacrymans S7.3]|uniref:Uncharacterized protein n=1 Tax=Serpula lacrymans var. lacrymans (strain S7.3) TaxID=936435 RepID=F8Q4Y9_SERL3|nr:hypothetical protein SERLA73DRAFT_58688 [Serpula lacrymans var. lacrymans S7.3]
MGQRHQAFVIARIRPAGGGPPRLRCIAAFHHQWCYGTLPLGATRRFLTLVKQKSNADIIKAEIRAIEGKYTDRQDFPAVPCPFVAFLLASSWTTDLEDPKNRYISGRLFSHSILNANMESGAGGKEYFACFSIE